MEPELPIRKRKKKETVRRFLLDPRLFRRLSASAEALERFRVSAAQHRLCPGAADGGLPPLELTPMGFLEALGIEPPRLDSFPLPAGVTRSGDAMDAITLVIQFNEKRLREMPELSAETLGKRADEMRGVLRPGVEELFDLCVDRFLARDGAVNGIVKQLAFDTPYRFSFPDTIREEAFEFLSASLFAAGENASALSKMRVMKTLWDRAYPRLLRANPGSRDDLQALDRDMRFGTRKAYLTWEMVHHSILGSAEVPKRYQPVTAFAPEPPEKLRSRVIAYKSALRAFLDQISRDDRARMREQLDAWKPGVLVPCHEDGTCGDPIRTGDLPIYVAAEK